MTLTVAVSKRLGAFEIESEFSSSGRLTALFGRSGAGKTSLVNMIAGLTRPDRGRIAVDGTVLFDSMAGIDVAAHRRRVGYVFQEGRLFPHLSVRANLLYGRRLARRADRWGTLDGIVELLGIGHLLNRRPAGLSGGEKQRVAIGRALLSGPRLLLLDEPLAAIDVERKAEILPYIERLRDEMSLPIVYVSHSVDEVARLADTVVLVAEGRAVATGPVGEVFARLELGALAEDVQIGGVLTGTIAAHDEAAGTSRLDHPAGPIVVPRIDAVLGTAVRLRVRLRDVALAVGEPGRLSFRNRLAGTVTGMAELPGTGVDVALDLGGQPLVARVTRDAVADLGLVTGSPVTVLIKATAFDIG
jgi:molybdate transport system ATP-binding protein